MKKVLLVLLFLFLLAAAGLAFFIITFDADHYRPQVTSRLQEVMGQPVEIRKITLGWDNGIALSIKGVRIFDGQGEGATPFFDLESASAGVPFAALLRGQVLVSALRIDHPFIRIVRNPDGSLKGLEKFMAGTPSPESGERNAAFALAVLLDSVEIQGATLIFRDLMSPQPVEIPLERVDIRLRDVALERPVPLEVKASLFSREQNIHLDAVLKYSLARQSFSVSDAQARLALASLDPVLVERSIPSVKAADFPRGLQGAVRVSMKSFESHPQGTDMAPVDVTLDQGTLPLSGMAPIDNVQLKARWTPESAVVESFSGLLAGGTLALSGDLRQVPPEPVGAFKFTASGLDAAVLIPPASERDPYLSGVLSVVSDARVTGLSASRAIQTFTGQGRVLLKEGVIHNFNLIREVIQKLSLIPGLQRGLQERLPPDYLEQINKPDTVLAPMDVPVVMEGPRIALPQIQAASENFVITGALELTWMGGIGGRFMLRLDPYFSEALIRTVNELQYLANARGELEFPVTVQGTTARPSVGLDLQYIGSRLATAKTQELLGSIFQKKPPAQTAGQPQPAASAPAPAPQPQPASPGAALFGQLLDSVLGGQQTSEPSRQ